MREKRNVVRVTVGGEEYAIRSDASPEHTRAVAQHVDEAIKRVLNTAPVVESHKAAILAALQITDELFRLRDERERTDERAAALAEEIRRWLPPARRGEERAVEDA